MSIKDLRHKIIPRSIEPLIDDTYRKGRVRLANVRYKHPARGLKVIAVTGTNGKTSTCNFLNDILKGAGYSTAMFTTAVIEQNGVSTLNTSHRTVPPTQELLKFLGNARRSNVDWVILETTSHALHQHKMLGIPIEYAVMTNLTQDHLDYHGTMELYAASKARLFGNYMKPKVCILNSDDDWFEYYKKHSMGRVITYGKTKNTSLRISNLATSIAGIKMRLDYGDTSIITTAPVLGEFNAYNIAAAASVALEIGISPDVLRKCIASIHQIPGRMELIPSKKGFTAVVDYAHAPDALEKALQALRDSGAKRVVAVFGATGDRDNSKRPIMGDIASSLADVAYLTDDETYTENGDDIRKQVMAGVKDGNRNKVTEIADRLEAITAAIKGAKKGDMILVAGLGHQDYRAMNEGHIPWQESEIVKNIVDHNL